MTSHVKGFLLWIMLGIYDNVIMLGRIERLTFEVMPWLRVCGQCKRRVVWSIVSFEPIEHPRLDTSHWSVLCDLCETLGTFRFFFSFLLMISSVCVYLIWGRSNGYFTWIISKNYCEVIFEDVRSDEKRVLDLVKIYGACSQVAKKSTRDVTCKHCAAQQ